MAINLKFNPDKGAGDKTVSVQCPRHTGRSSRTQNVLVSDGYSNCTVAVTQTGASETAYWVSTSSIVSCAAPTISLTAKTNAVKSYVAFVSNAAGATITEYSYSDGTTLYPTTVSVSSGSITIQPATDIGAVSEYTVYVKLTFPENTGLTTKTAVLSFRSDNVTASSITLTQSGITLPYITEETDSYNVGSGWYINIKNPSTQSYKLKLATGSSSIIKVTRLNGRTDLTESFTDACTFATERLLVKALTAGEGTVVLADAEGTQLDSYTAYVTAVPTTDTPGGDDPGTDTPDTPTVSEGNFVDLGLPSGTLWMDRNIGASSIEGLGSRYAWGETATKNFTSTIYDTSTHLVTVSTGVLKKAEADYTTYAPNLGGKSFASLYDSEQLYWLEPYAGSESTLYTEAGRFEMACIGGYLRDGSLGGGDIKGTRYDAACVYYEDLGVNTPTTYQYNELCNCCTVEEATVNTVKGYRFKSTQTGYTDKSIFIPCNSTYTKTWGEGSALEGHVYENYAVLWLSNGGTRNGSVIQIYTDVYTEDETTTRTVVKSPATYGMYFGLNIRACTTGRFLYYNNENQLTVGGENPHFNIGSNVIKVLWYNSELAASDTHYYGSIPEATTVYVSIFDPFNKGWYPAFGGIIRKEGDTRNGRTTDGWTPFSIAVKAAETEGGTVTDHTASEVLECEKFYGNGILSITATTSPGRYNLNLLNENRGTTTYAQNVVWISYGMTYPDTYPNP